MTDSHDEDGQPAAGPDDAYHPDGSANESSAQPASERVRPALRSGAPACLTVSLLDGLVLARAAMHHSANYRSVVLLGRARAVDDPDEQRLACREIVEHVVPGRWEDVRPPSENELKAT